MYSGDYGVLADLIVVMYNSHISVMCIKHNSNSNSNENNTSSSNSTSNTTTSNNTTIHTTINTAIVVIVLMITAGPRQLRRLRPRRVPDGGRQGAMYMYLYVIMITYIYIYIYTCMCIYGGLQGGPIL